MKDVLPRTEFRLELDGRSLKIGDIVAFARRSGDAECALSAQSMEKIEATRELKRDLIEREVPIYGVTADCDEGAPGRLEP